MDRKEFGNLILENERQLYRIAKSILRSDEDCADAAQETVMKAFEKLHTLRDDRYAKTWLIRILINECFRMADKQKRERMLADKVKSCEEQAHKEIERRAMCERRTKIDIAKEIIEGNDGNEKNQ